MFSVSRTTEFFTMRFLTSPIVMLSVPWIVVFFALLAWIPV